MEVSLWAGLLGLCEGIEMAIIYGGGNSMQCLVNPLVLLTESFQIGAPQ